MADPEKRYTLAQYIDELLKDRGDGRGGRKYAVGSLLAQYRKGGEVAMERALTQTAFASEYEDLISGVYSGGDKVQPVPYDATTNGEAIVKNFIQEEQARRQAQAPVAVQCSGGVDCDLSTTPTPGATPNTGVGGRKAATP